MSLKNPRRHKKETAHITSLARGLFVCGSLARGRFPRGSTARDIIAFSGAGLYTGTRSDTIRNSGAPRHVSSAVERICTYARLPSKSTAAWKDAEKHSQLGSAFREDNATQHAVARPLHQCRDTEYRLQPGEFITLRRVRLHLHHHRRQPFGRRKHVESLEYFQGDPEPPPRGALEGGSKQGNGGPKRTRCLQAGAANACTCWPKRC